MSLLVTFYWYDLHVSLHDSHYNVAVAQSVRALASYVESWVFEYQLRQT